LPRSWFSWFYLASPRFSGGQLAFMAGAGVHAVDAFSSEIMYAQNFWLYATLNVMKPSYIIDS
jgi:hypothetical protein